MRKYIAAMIIGVCFNLPLMAQDEAPDATPEGESIEYECRMKVAEQQPPEQKIESLIERCIENTRKKEPNRDPGNGDGEDGVVIDENTPKPLPPGAPTDP